MKSQESNLILQVSTNVQIFTTYFDQVYSSYTKDMIMATGDHDQTWGIII